MKRRHALQSLAALPAAAALPALSSAQTQTGSTAAAAAPAPEGFPLATVVPDAVGQPRTRFFTGPQMAALERLSTLIVPSTEGRPGAKEAQAAEFLDFLLSQSPAPRQSLYRQGLALLDAAAVRQHKKAFSALTDSEAAGVLTPLAQPWTYQGPTDPLGQFLVAAKADLLQATINSRPWAQALSARTRGGAGMGTYWFPVE